MLNEDQTKNKRDKKQFRVAQSYVATPTYYIGGHNGVSLVDGPLSELGWRRITDKNCDTFKLKWCEGKGSINYPTFKEGEQLVNHIPNSQLLCNKLGLLNSLLEYERIKRPPLRMNSFFPETFKIDEKPDRERFLEVCKENEMWICKPTGLNQGIGISLLRGREEAQKLCEEREQKQEASRRQSRQPMGRIVQRYILHPMLLEGKKFDIRCYMLIACCQPFLLLYHKGYVRLSLHNYDKDSSSLTVHLTNQYIQKKDTSYQDCKETTAWSWEKFNEYVNENYVEKNGVEMDWVENTLTKTIHRVILHLFHCVKNKLNAKLGYFDLYGLDFMVQDNLRVDLIEVNTNPSLATNCSALQGVIPGVVRDTLSIVSECLEKGKRGEPLLPLKTDTTFTVLACEERGSQIGGGSNRSRSLSPARAVSPGRPAGFAAQPRPSIGSLPRAAAASPSRGAAVAAPGAAVRPPPAARPPPVSPPAKSQPASTSTPQLAAQPVYVSKTPQANHYSGHHQQLLLQQQALLQQLQQQQIAAQFSRPDSCTLLTETRGIIGPLQPPNKTILPLPMKAIGVPLNYNEHTHGSPSETAKRAASPGRSRSIPRPRTSSRESYPMSTIRGGTFNPNMNPYQTRESVGAFNARTNPYIPHSPVKLVFTHNARSFAAPPDRVQQTASSSVS